MSLAERLLIALSRRPEAGDDPIARSEWTVDNGLSLLSEVFPKFTQRVIDKVVLDFGCGFGYQSIALAHAGARMVVGVDTNPRTLEHAVRLAGSLHVTGRVQFRPNIPPAMLGNFDMVISQNSMEHFPDPSRTIGEMSAALTPDGRILVTFGPPWHAPYGAHMFFFTRVPWVNLFFAETTVMTVRRRYRNDGATRYEDVESGLNKMTVTKFERIVSAAGLEVEFARYDCVKHLPLIDRVPKLRELFINRVSSILRIPPE